MTSNERLGAAIQTLRRDPETPALEEQIRHDVPVLVHNARLGAAGIRDGLNAADEERRCREAEIDFGLAVPGGEVAVERARVLRVEAEPDRTGLTERSSSTSPCQLKLPINTRTRRTRSTGY